VKISVVIPVKNGAATLNDCLDGIYSQEIGGSMEMDVLAVDSGSDDGSLRILNSYPLRLISIHPGDFDHGDTRNLGAAETNGDLIVFTVQDAVPLDKSWLKRLASNLLSDEAAAGAFSRIVPRPDCGPLVEKGVMGDVNFSRERKETVYDGFNAPEGWDPHTHRIRANFNDVASCIRRSVWERIPYQRTSFGEDIIWADSVLRAGYKIIFDPESVVVHSHEYRPSSVYPRTHIDAWFNRAYIRRSCIEKPGHVLIMTMRHFHEDRAFLKEKGLCVRSRIKESATSLSYHFMEFLGFYQGGRADERVMLPSEPFRSGALKILLLLSGQSASDPAASDAASALASALKQMGHDVVFACCPREGEGSGADADAEDEEGGSGVPFGDGFPVHKLSFGSSTDDKGGSRFDCFSPDIEKSIEELLEKEAPDVVHCLDFREFTSIATQVFEKHGIPRIVTVNDFWFCCPRGDLVLPDGSFCCTRRPPGIGCSLCFMKGMEFIFFASLVDKMIKAGLRFVFSSRMRSIEETDAAGGHGFPSLLPRLFKRPLVMRRLLNGVDFVMASSLMIKSRLELTGIDPGKVVHNGYGSNGKVMERLGKSTEGPGPLQIGTDFMSCEAEAGPRCAREMVIKYKQAISKRMAAKRDEGRRDAEPGFAGHMREV